jgi:general secretion pathway protein I
MRRAFTLVEVLVALAIFAMAVVVLGAAYVQVMNVYELAARAGQADADLTSARVALMAEPDVEKAREGDEADTTDGGRLRWRARIEPTDLPDLFEVELEVELRGREGETRTHLERFRLLRPTWSDAGERETLRSETAERIRKLREVLERGRS